MGDKKVKKGKVCSRTGHEGPEEQRYNSTLSLTSVLDGGGCQRHAPAVLPSGKRLGNRFIGGWVGLRWEDNIKTDNIKTDLQEILAR